MATLLTWPLLQQPSANGVAVTAATITGSGVAPQPLLPGGVVQPGAMLRLGATGEITCSSSSPTVILGFYQITPGGSVQFGSALCVTAALPISASAVAWPFILEYEGTFRAIASTPSIHGQGKCFWGGNSGLGTAFTVYPMPITQALRTVALGNGMNQGTCYDVGVTLSATTGSPSVLITDLWGEIAG